MAENVSKLKGNAPLGIRLCNPLNIIRSSATWQGLAEIQKHPHFCEFHTLEYGWRAAIINIAVTYRKRGWDTIEKIITHWAPPHENPTPKYIGFVEQYTGIPRHKKLEDIRKNPSEYRLVLIGMAKFEQGYVWINPTVIDRFDKALSRLLQKDYP